MTREQAVEELARADAAAGRVRRKSRWIATYLAVFGVGFGAVTLLLGLVEPLALRMTIFFVCGPVLVVGMVVWSRRQPAAPRGRLWGWLGTGILYGVALFVGTPGLEGRVEYWLPAAVVVALPLCVAGWREHRS